MISLVCPSHRIEDFSIVAHFRSKSQFFGALSQGGRAQISIAEEASIESILILGCYAIVDPVERASQICSDKLATVIFFLKMFLCRDDNKEWGFDIEGEESRCGWQHIT
jgi:hypothetical protein